MIDGELVAIIVNLLLVSGFLWWMLHPRHKITKSRRCRNRCRKLAKCAVRCAARKQKSRANSGSVRGAETAAQSNKVWVQKQPG